MGTPKAHCSRARQVAGNRDAWQLYDAAFARVHQREIAHRPPVDDFYTERFRLDHNKTVAVQASSPVLQLNDGSLVACEDRPICHPLGLNHPAAMKLLPKLALGDGEVGPAVLRWSKDAEFFAAESPVVVLGFLRVTLRTDESRGWLEHATALRLFVIGAAGEAREMDSSEVRKFINGLYSATARTKMPEMLWSIESLLETEAALAEQLRRPSPEELSERKRHAVASVFVGVVEKE